jgi:hypothetical protein
MRSAHQPIAASAWNERCKKAAPIIIVVPVKNDLTIEEPYLPSLTGQ